MPALQRDTIIARLSEASEELSPKLRKIAKIEATMEDRIAQIKAEYADTLDALREEAQTLADCILSTAERYEGKILQGLDKKTVQLSDGTLSFKDSVPSLVITDEDELRESLEALGLGSEYLVEVDPKIDKVGLKANPTLVTQLSGVKLLSKTTATFTPTKTATPEGKIAPLKAQYPKE